MEPFHFNTAIFLLLQLLVFSLFFELFWVNCNALGQCLQAESSTLLQLKRGFTSGELDTWRLGTDCCIWEGVTCDESKQVTSLDLSNRSIAGTIDSSLFNLSSLRTLNFSYNLFDGMSIPDSGWDKLANLLSIDLSHAGFVGKVPKKIFRLRNLKYLDISYNPTLSGSLLNFPKDNNLNFLVLSHTNFSGNLPDTIGNLKSLMDLDLSGCQFYGRVPSLMGNLSQLVSLDLSDNNFSGPIPFFLPFSRISKPIHNVLLVPDTHFCLHAVLCNLELLDLSNNSFSGPIPTFVFTLPALRRLVLHQNQFSGQLAEFSNASSLLIEVDLSENKLQGQIPISLLQISGLVILSLASNNFSGVVELEFIKDLKNLSYLDLSDSGFSLSPWDADDGSSSSSFPNMSTLKLVGCNLTKIPTFIKYQHRLLTLDLSNNRIHGEIPSDFWSVSEQNWLTSFIPSNVSSQSYLTFLFLANNNLTGEIPPSICNLTKLQVLDLSDNMLMGSIPRCLLEQGIHLQVLHLRGNQLHGAIPHEISPKCELQIINLRDNQLEGLLPRSLSNCRSLMIMDLGNNNLKGAFPYWLGNYSSLRVLVLRSNKFHGLVGSPNGNHETNYTFPMLHVFDISSNNFSGNLCVECFSNFKSMIINKSDTIYDFAYSLGGRYYDLNVPTIMKKGQLMMLQKFWLIIRSIDLSNNHFVGEIPITIGQLVSLQVLNMSQNNFTGKIPPQLGNLLQLESLDLSMNDLSGKIPQELVSLYFLSYLNLSYNKLVGKIPLGGQFSTFPNTAFEGNEGLCCWFPRNTSLPKLNNTAASPPRLGSRAPKNRSYMIVMGILFGVGLGGSMATVVVLDVIYCNRGRRRRSRRPIHG